MESGGIGRWQVVWVLNAAQNGDKAVCQLNFLEE
jgi:hypothetical protein